MRFLFVLWLLAATSSLQAQNITGFRNGDIALNRFLERNLSLDNRDDSITYRFTLAAVCFDSLGNIDTIKYSSEGQLEYKAAINRVLHKTAGMWDKTVVRNQILTIPFELINYYKRDVESYQTSERMLSNEFLKMFQDQVAHSMVMIRPIVIITYGPLHKNAL